MIPALVLTAGLATRLRPLSLVRAKAALPVAGEPLACRILRTLRSSGITDAVLNLHHLPHTLTSRIGDGASLGLRVRYSWETPVLGSGGGPRHALPLLGPGSTFLIVNGDTLASVDVGALVDAHRRSGALITMAVVPNAAPHKYGGVLAEADGAVTGFVARGARDSSYHFVGVQVAEAEAFASLPDGVPHETVGGLYPELIRARRGAVHAHLSASEFFDIGTPADYLDTALLIAKREGRPPDRGARVRIAPDARLEDTILWDDVEVGEGAFLRQCVVTDGACVPAGTSWIGVSIRRAEGELAPNERRVEDLAIAGL
jgi:NDP-sugar pyrophosphorylase family protein